MREWVRVSGSEREFVRVESEPVRERLSETRG